MTNYIERPTSEQSTLIRKGKLGTSKNGLYVSFLQKNKTENEFKLKGDITNNYLLMKQINVDYEKIDNLPYKVEEKILIMPLKR